MYNDLYDPEGRAGLQPINMRALNGAGVEKCKVVDLDGKSISPGNEEVEEVRKQFWAEQKRKAGV